ncbi:hypothetical protein LCGC14_1185980 [marine sediment metagenome]|uniref:Carboxymuconolactone decarboxylase-like domain-containing protein n=1 Tax=marine sediment metagenome TaxID=412755 RepID=A0A0F9M8J0_9ZZZZ
MANNHNDFTTKREVLAAKEDAIVELACMIGFGAPDSLDGQFKKAAELGLSNNDLTAVVSKAMCVKNNARDLINKTAYKKVGNDIYINDCCADEQITRLKEISAIASAVGTNSLTNYKKHVSIGKEVGLTNEEVEAITKTAFSAKTKLLHGFKLSVGENDASGKDKHQCSCNNQTNENSGSDKSSSGCC